MHRNFTATEIPWKTFLKSISLQRFSTWNNNQGTLFINAEITGNALYFHRCSRETIFFGVGHAAIISFAPVTHTEGTQSCSRPVLSVLGIFQWLDKVAVDLALSTLRFSNTFAKDFVPPDTPTLLLCLTQACKDTTSAKWRKLPCNWLQTSPHINRETRSSISPPLSISTSQ